MFGKKIEAESRAMASARNAAGSTFSMLGSDISVKGDITASADLHIDGSVEGDIACSCLVQGESSRIDGGIVAESARLSGKVDGSISCGELVILKSARIRGDVSYDTLTIEQGAVVDGRLTPRGAVEPTRLSQQAEQGGLVLAAAE